MEENSIELPKDFESSNSSDEQHQSEEGDKVPQMVVEALDPTDVKNM